MNFEERVCRLERQNRILWRVLYSAAIVGVVLVSIGARQLQKDLFVHGKLEIQDPTTQETKIALRPDGSALVGGSLEVKGKLRAPTLELASNDGTRAISFADIAACSAVRSMAAYGGDPATDAVSTDSVDSVDIPGLKIPFEREAGTTVLVYFSSGEMELPVGESVTFSLGYEQRDAAATQSEFVVLRKYALSEIYYADGADFVWVGTIPAKTAALGMRWRTATGQTVTMGVDGGDKRSLFVVEFPADDPPGQ